MILPFSLLLATAQGLFHTAAAEPVTSQPSVASELQRCGALSDDAARLRCYDRLARSNSSKSSNDIVTLSDANTAASSPKVSPHRPPRPLRIELGYGSAIGDYSGVLSVSSQGRLKVDSATGGSGAGLMGQIWLDDWPRKSFSVGLEYIRIDNHGSLTAILPQGGSVLTNPVYGYLGVGVRADVAMANIAYRPASFGWIRPVAGLGLGVGYGSASENFALQNAFIGNSNTASKATAPFPVLQGFVGVEADLPHRVYVSLMSHVLLVSARPVGIDQSYTDYIIETNIGYRFH
jgi:hypothetical protein